MFVVLEILPSDPVELPIESPSSRLEKSEYMEEEEDFEEDSKAAFQKQEEDEMAMTGQEIGLKCMNAVSMIDDLLNQQDDEFGFDDISSSNPFAPGLKKQDSYQIGPDGTRQSVINDEEIRKIKERVEAEKLESLK